jgi:hypothetical protein
MILIQAISDSIQRAPDAPIWLWGLSEVLVTIIVFIGVYFIFKPVFGKKEKDD